MVRTSPRKKKQTVISFEKATAFTAKTTSKAPLANGNLNGVQKETVTTTTKTKVEITKSGMPKRKASEKEEDEYTLNEKTEPEPPAKKQRTKSTAGKGKGKGNAKEEDMKPLAARTAVASLKKAMYIGAHISAAGGVHNAVQNATHIGANSFALFLKSQRKWTNPPLDPTVRDQFVKLCGSSSYDAAQHVLPHGSYLVNLAQRDRDKEAQAFAAFVDDLKRCDELGIRLYNFHPGNTGGEDMGEACRRIGANINRAHAETRQVVTVLENMAGTGNTIGGRFEELRDIIAAVEDKERVAVCLDTCHAFAAGYDLRTKEAFDETVKKFDEVVGLKYLKAFHLNDSKAPLASHRDLHANIGTGFLGLGAFYHIVNYPAFQGLPMVLETPIERKGPDGKMVEEKQVWADEIKLLEGLIGADPESEEFKALEARLQKEGASERAKFQDQVDRRAEKGKKKTGKGKGKAAGKKKAAASDEESE